MYNVHLCYMLGYRHFENPKFEIVRYNNNKEP